MKFLDMEEFGRHRPQLRKSGLQSLRYAVPRAESKRFNATVAHIQIVVSYRRYEIYNLCIHILFHDAVSCSVAQAVYRQMVGWSMNSEL
jgi:hypothetical protein